MLAPLDLNLLVVLDAVLRERSVARAARRLHVTPSAISNSLARLRAELGDPLVIRSGRGIVPTPRASELAPLLERALRDVERAVQTVAFDASSSTRQFTLAIADAGQLSRLPQLTLLLAQEMPHARLRVVGIDTFLSSGGLAGTEVDVAIAGLEDKARGVHLLPLYEEHAVLVARRGTVRGGRASKAQLATLKHVDVEVAPGRGFKALARNYAQIGIEREVALVVPNFVAAAAIVAATDLVATLPTSLVEAMGGHLGLQVLQTPAPRITINIKLAWHDRTHDDPALRAFRELIVRSASAQ